MGHCLFLYDNLWDEGVLTCSSELTNFPASRTRNRWKTWTWRTDGILPAGEWIQNDRGEFYVGINAFSGIYNNYTPDAAGLLEGYESGNPVPLYSAAVDLNNIIFLHFIPPGEPGEQLQIWRFTVDDDLNPDGFLEIGRLFLGHAFLPRRGFHGDRDLYPEDPSIVTRSSGGQVSSVQKDRYQRRSYFFNLTDEHWEFQALFDWQGLSKGFVFCEDYRAPTINNTFYCQLVSYSWKHRYGDFWDLKLEIETLR